MDDSTQATRASADPRVGEILDIVARETKIDRERLQLDAKTADVGIGSLDLTLAVFEIETHFGIEIETPPEPPPGEAMTIGMLVDHVLAILDRSPKRALGVPGTSTGG